MAHVLTPNSGTLGEFGLTEAHAPKKKQGLPAPKHRMPERDEDDEYEHEMDQAAEDAMADAMDEGDEGDEENEKTRPPRRYKMRRHMAEVYKNGKKVEIHSAKWHRCVDKVAQRGGGYNEYAVCTASIGKAGSFAKGHGGSAAPKRK